MRPILARSSPITANAVTSCGIGTKRGDGRGDGSGCDDCAGIVACGLRGSGGGAGEFPVGSAFGGDCVVPSMPKTKAMVTISTVAPILNQDSSCLRGRVGVQCRSGGYPLPPYPSTRVQAQRLPPTPLLTGLQIAVTVVFQLVEMIERPRHKIRRR